MAGFEVSTKAILEPFSNFVTPGAPPRSTSGSMRAYLLVPVSWGMVPVITLRLGSGARELVSACSLGCFSRVPAGRVSFAALSAPDRRFLALASTFGLRRGFVSRLTGNKTGFVSLFAE